MTTKPWLNMKKILIIQYVLIQMLAPSLKPNHYDTGAPKFCRISLLRRHECSANLLSYKFVRGRAASLRRWWHDLTHLSVDWWPSSWLWSCSPCASSACSSRRPAFRCCSRWWCLRPSATSSTHDCRARLLNHYTTSLLCHQIAMWYLLCTESPHSVLLLRLSNWYKTSPPEPKLQLLHNQPS